MEMTGVLNSPRDVGAMRPADWPLRPLQGEVIGREKAFQAIFRQSVLDAIAAHGKSEPDVEVCGVLVGNIYSDGAAPYATVDAAISGEYSTGRSTQVTFTSETWTHINDVRDREYPSKQILGWYHTHPGFGIFLSEMDLFIHQSFFSEPWQLAFVFDPKSKEEGLFVWRDGKVVQDGFLVDHDTDGTPAETKRAAESPKQAPSGTVGELSERVQALEHRTKWLLAGGALAVLIAIVWPLAVVMLLPQVLPMIHAPSGKDANLLGGSPPTWTSLPLSPALIPPAHGSHAVPTTLPAAPTTMPGKSQTNSLEPETWWVGHHARTALPAAPTTGPDGDSVPPDVITGPFPTTQPTRGFTTKIVKP